MRTALIVLAVHLAVGATLWLLAILDWNPASFYSAVFFFLWNTPGVWVVKGLGMSPIFNAMGFTYGAWVTMGFTQAVLGVVLFGFLRLRKAYGA